MIENLTWDYEEVEHLKKIKDKINEIIDSLTEKEECKNCICVGGPKNGKHGFPRCPFNLSKEEKENQYSCCNSCWNSTYSLKSKYSKCGLSCPCHSKKQDPIDVPELNVEELLEEYADLVSTEPHNGTEATSFLRRKKKILEIIKSAIK